MFSNHLYWSFINVQETASIESVQCDELYYVDTSMKQLP